MSKSTRREFLKWLGVTTASAAIPTLSAEHPKDPNILEKRIARYTDLGDGKETIELKLTKKGQSDVTFFNIHDDENTAVQAAEKVVEEYGGRLIELKHRGTRHINFYLNGEEYKFDPNRIFTDRGITETLLNYKNYNRVAFGEVKKFRDWLLEQYSLGKSKVMIAVHNNTDGSYSILEYLKGGKYESDAKKVTKAKGKNQDDFFFVTKEEDYNHLASLGFNVVLQNNEKVNDDGSLSVYWAKEKKTPYINVEAQHGQQHNHLNEQVEMIKAAIKPYINRK